MVRVPLHRTTLLALGCCLLAVFGAGIALGTVPTGTDGAPAPEVLGNGNTSNYLQPSASDAVREGSAIQSVDVGVAVASDAASVDGYHERARFDSRIEDAPNETARLDRARAAVDNLTERTTRLRTASRDARAAFRSGSLSANAYFHRVARLDAEVDRASDYRRHLQARLTELESPPQSTLTDLQILEPDLETLEGPVVEEIRARYDGNGSGNTFVRVTGGDGYVVSTVSGDRLYREAQAGADWERGGTDRFEDGNEFGGLNAAANRVSELYPWTYSHQVGSPRPRGPFHPTSLYKFVLNHNHGELTLYLDGSTEDVFREVQSKDLDELPRDWHRSTTSDGIDLNVTGTTPTGALEIETTQATSDVGVASEIWIDDTHVGSTGADGRLWTVQPSGGFTVNATSSDGSVTLSVVDETT